jgi:hypothetical protein
MNRIVSAACGGLSEGNKPRNPDLFPRFNRTVGPVGHYIIPRL